MKASANLEAVQSDSSNMEVGNRRTQTWNLTLRQLQTAHAQTWNQAESQASANLEAVQSDSSNMEVGNRRTQTWNLQLRRLQTAYTQTWNQAEGQASANLEAVQSDSSNGSRQTSYSNQEPDIETATDGVRANLESSRRPT